MLFWISAIFAFIVIQYISFFVCSALFLRENTAFILHNLEQWVIGITGRNKILFDLGIFVVIMLWELLLIGFLLYAWYENRKG